VKAKESVINTGCSELLLLFPSIFEGNAENPNIIIQVISVHLRI